MMRDMRVMFAVCCHGACVCGKTPEKTRKVFQRGENIWRCCERHWLTRLMAIASGLRERYIRPKSKKKKVATRMV